MGTYAATGKAGAVYVTTIAGIGVCVGTLRSHGVRGVSRSSLSASCSRTWPRSAMFASTGDEGTSVGA